MSADEPFIAEIIFSADPRDPVTIDLDSKALKITLMNRQQIARLDADLGQRPGVYLLLGGTGSAAAVEVYIGKTGGGKQGFRGRVRNHIRKPSPSVDFPWLRAVLITRATTPGWNSAQIGYLEGMLVSELSQVPGIRVRNVRDDIDTSLGRHRERVLEEFLPSIYAVLRLAGLEQAGRDVQEESAPSASSQGAKRRRQGDRSQNTPRPAGSKYTYHGISVKQLVASGLLAPGTELRFSLGADQGRGRVDAQGRIVVGQQAYESPSTAGKAICGRANNGWDCWALAAEPQKRLLDIREEYKARQQRQSSTGTAGSAPGGALSADGGNDLGSPQADKSASRGQLAGKPSGKAQHWARVSDLVDAGVLPSGTELIYIRAGKEVPGRVNSRGQIIVNQRAYDTPTGAAKSIYGRPISGWEFWFLSSDRSQSLAMLRDGYELQNKSARSHQ